MSIQNAVRGHVAVARREFIAFGATGRFFARSDSDRLRPIVISVHAMLDRGAHSGRGLVENELAAFKSYQEKARREFAISGIQFNIRVVEGAYLRQQGYSEIPDKFLAPKMINLFVTDSLGYDIDRDRTGGCSMGPRPPGPKSGGDAILQDFPGLARRS